MFEKEIAKAIKIEGVTPEEIEGMFEIPKDVSNGDLALPCFKFAKAFRKSPVVIAEELKNGFAGVEVVSEVKAIGGYLNFKINEKAILSQIVELSKDENPAASDEGKGKTICIDYSSVNIAKPFHIGHLSTTVIGGALYRIFKHLGYNVVGINHLGDWGTQFGKMIVAYKKWGDKDEVINGGVVELNRLYVKFHQEAEKAPELDDEARAWFKKIEDGDKEAIDLFLWFKDITLKEVSKIYDRLKIKFDSYNGESFYNDKMQPCLDMLKEKGLLVESDGAQVVNLDE
ncbi:MAG: arginine--tRNA ligase, partial [Christensenellales bacterium]